MKHLGLFLNYPRKHFTLSLKTKEKCKFHSRVYYSILPMTKITFFQAKLFYYQRNMFTEGNTK